MRDDRARKLGALQGLLLTEVQQQNGFSLMLAEKHMAATEQYQYPIMQIQ